MLPDPQVMYGIAVCVNKSQPVLYNDIYELVDPSPVTFYYKMTVVVYVPDTPLLQIGLKDTKCTIPVIGK